MTWYNMVCDNMTMYNMNKVCDNMTVYYGVLNYNISVQFCVMMLHSTAWYGIWRGMSIPKSGIVL